MAYKFALESVLRHRQRLEDEAQREFLVAQAAVNEALAVIESMYKRFDEVREEIGEAQRAGTSGHIALVVEMEAFLIGFTRQIEMKRLEARELLMVAESKQETLVLAAREKKVLAKLKEKRLLERKEWLKQIEVKEMDDMTTMRRGRR